jgi:23S rRNA pseudouridine1911/1915/1917 synthase
MMLLDVLHEDENLIAVNKPAGLLVTPDRWDRGIPTIQDMLREYLRKKVSGEHPNIRLIHRLDKDTSGVIVLAKNVKAQSYVSKQFEAGEVSKSYHAIVKGEMRKDDGIINMPLMESPKRPGTMVVNKKGKKSISLYKVLERFRDFTLVEVNPLTGRTHQVRVHMSAAGYPLAIDPLYGSSSSIYLSELKKDYKPKNDTEKPIIHRLPLHAFRLSFREPTEGKTILLEAPLPRDFSRMIKSLRKYQPLAPVGS